MERGNARSLSESPSAMDIRAYEIVPYVSSPAAVGNQFCSRETQTMEQASNDGLVPNHERPLDRDFQGKSNPVDGVTSRQAGESVCEQGHVSIEDHVLGNSKDIEPTRRSSVPGQKVSRSYKESYGKSMTEQPTEWKALKRVRNEALVKLQRYYEMERKKRCCRSMIEEIVQCANSLPAIDEEEERQGEQLYRETATAWNNVRTVER